MINLDQVRTLEWKVKQAVQLIVHLRRENDTLRGRLSDTEVRLQELESLLESFKATQNEMESGIRSALEDLDNLEVGQTPASSQVDALSYPPEQTFASEDPAGVFDKASSPKFADQDPAGIFDKAPTPEPARDLTFEEEYAALAAAEAEAEAEVRVEPVEVAEPVSVPESVELEDEVLATSSEENLFLDPEPVAEPEEPEEKQPEQPGLGIF